MDHKRGSVLVEEEPEEVEEKLKIGSEVVFHKARWVVKRINLHKSTVTLKWLGKI